MLKRLYFSILALILCSPLAVFAAKIDLPSEDYGLPTTEGRGVAGILAKLIATAANIVATASVVALILAAFLYMTARGEEEKVTKAKKMIGWVIGGLLIAIFSWSILNIFFNLEPFKTTEISHEDGSKTGEQQGGCYVSGKDCFVSTAER
jgi:cytochrome bd-type quinol oxidase subunit 2